PFSGDQAAQPNADEPYFFYKRDALQALSGGTHDRRPGDGRPWQPDLPTLRFKISKTDSYAHRLGPIAFPPGIGEHCFNEAFQFFYDHALAADIVLESDLPAQ